MLGKGFKGRKIPGRARVFDGAEACWVWVGAPEFAWAETGVVVLLIPPYSTFNFNIKLHPELEAKSLGLLDRISNFPSQIQFFSY